MSNVGQFSWVAIFATAGISAVTAILTILITSALTRRREHEADWRKLKLAQYQEYVLALSGVVRERATANAQRRYADAVNSMALIAPITVLSALKAFQREISYKNENRTDAEHDRLLAILIRAIRADVHPDRPYDDSIYEFHLLGLPPDTKPADDS